jgi:hypothetical protein
MAPAGRWNELVHEFQNAAILAEQKTIVQDIPKWM